MRYLSAIVLLFALPALLSGQGKVSIDISNYYFNETRVLKHLHKPNVILKNLVTKSVSEYSIDTSITLAKSFTPSVTYGVDRKEPQAYIHIPAYIKNEYGVEQLVSYELEVQELPIPATNYRGQRVYASTSVLAAHNWYKIAVPQTAIYTISHEFIKTKLGVDPATISPDAIRIYGYGNGMVPEANITLRPDDLIENPIQLIGMNDGKWDPSDYLLFYGQGPDEIIKDSLNKSFTHSKNLYADSSYYFLTLDMPGGKRIVTNNISQPETDIVTSFDQYVYAEKDSASLSLGGKAWLGEIFGSRAGAPSNREIILSTGAPMVFDSFANVNVHLASNGTNTGSRFNITLNGAVAGSVFLDKVGTAYFDLTFTSAVLNAKSRMSGTQCKIGIQYENIDEYAYGFLDYVSLQARCSLTYSNKALFFRDWTSVGAGKVAKYVIQSATNANVWDITQIDNVQSMNVTFTGTSITFNRDASRLREFVCFNPTDAIAPYFVQKISNQNLHGQGPADLLIVTHEALLNQAQQLAEFHKKQNNLRVNVATASQIYNEFSSGRQDISAIRDYAKMFYDRATNPKDMPSSLCLFGDASFDPKGRVKGTVNLIPSRQTNESKLRINIFVSDDFFAMLDDVEDINNSSIANVLDIGIGRIPVSTAAQAQVVVDKVKKYYSSSSYGPWKNNLTFCADNKDVNGAVHMNDAEQMTKTVKDSMPDANRYKIYLDGFPVYAIAGGNRSPQAKQALDALLFNGTLAVNYNGHGGPQAWCEERIFHISDINTYRNINKLPLFITATCDFAPYDQILESAGEKLLTYDQGGAIGLMTTTALVFQYENVIINRDFWKNAFARDQNNQSLSFGEIFRRTKNNTYKNVLSETALVNFRKFALLADPASGFHLPNNKVILETINGKPINPQADTLKSLNVYTLTGSVRNAQSQVLDDFNGTAYISIYDKVKKLKTLETNPTDPKLTYELQNDVIFNGKSNVINGKFTASFIVPKDINYTIGNAKVSLYAHSSNQEAIGSENGLMIGGAGENSINDIEGPTIKPYLNDSNFISGGLTGPSSTLLINLYDENGINTTGTSVGHDITAILDGNTNEVISLNNFYQGANNDYKRGTVQYPLKNVSPGPHTLTIKAWDVLNNSNTAKLDFVVGSDKAEITRVLNYPNPFFHETEFWFEHNHPNEVMTISVQIFTITGKPVRTLQKVISSPGSQVRDLKWDGKDEFGQKLGKGVYFYQISYKTLTGNSSQKIEKLVIL